MVGDHHYESSIPVKGHCAGQCLQSSKQIFCQVVIHLRKCGCLHNPTASGVAYATGSWCISVSSWGASWEGQWHLWMGANPTPQLSSLFHLCVFHIGLFGPLVQQFCTWKKGIFPLPPSQWKWKENEEHEVFRSFQSGTVVVCRAGLITVSSRLVHVATEPLTASQLVIWWRQSWPILLSFGGCFLLLW